MHRPHRTRVPARVPEPPRRRDRLPPPDQRRPEGRDRLGTGQGSQSAPDRGIELRLTDDAKEFLIKEGCKSLDYGARPLRRAIESRVEDPLSEELLRGEFQGKDEIVVDVVWDTNHEKIVSLKFEGQSAKDASEPVAAAAGSHKGGGTTGPPGRRRRIPSSGPRGNTGPLSRAFAWAEPAPRHIGRILRAWSQPGS